MSILTLIVAHYCFGDKGLWPMPWIFGMLNALGVAALASTLTILIDRHFVTRSFATLVGQEVRAALGVKGARDLQTSVKSIVENALDLDRSLLKHGLVRAHEPPFDFKCLFQCARPGDEIWWLDTYCPRKDEFLVDLKEALMRNVSIRVLIIHPGCQNAGFRAEELAGQADSGPRWKSGLEDFRLRIESLAEVHERLEIRYYRDLPCVPMYLIRDGREATRAFFSLFLCKATAHFVHLELNPGLLLREMDQYFVSKWERARPGPLTSIDDNWLLEQPK